MKSVVAAFLALAVSAQAQWFGPRTYQIRVAHTNFETLGYTPGTNLHDVLNWIDDNWPQFDSSGYQALNPTQDSLRVLSQWLDDNWPDRASRIYFNTNGLAVLSGTSSNLQTLIGSIDTNLALRYPVSNPSNYVTQSDVFAQPQAVLFRGNSVVTQWFYDAVSAADIGIVNATTSGPASYIFLTNGMTHTHGASSDFVNVPTSGWYLVMGQISGTLYGPHSANLATFDSWAVFNGERLDGSGYIYPGARSWLQVSQASNSATVVGQWFKQNGSALLYAPTSGAFSVNGQCSGVNASAAVNYVSFEIRRIAP